MNDTLNLKVAQSICGYKVDVPYVKNTDAIEEIRGELLSLTKKVIPELPQEIRLGIENQYHSQVDGLMDVLMGKGYAHLTLPLGYDFRTQ
jgi:hypothetical protein